MAYKDLQSFLGYYNRTYGKQGIRLNARDAMHQCDKVWGEVIDHYRVPDKAFITFTNSVARILNFMVDTVDIPSDITPVTETAITNEIDNTNTLVCSIDTTDYFWLVLVYNIDTDRWSVVYYVDGKRFERREVSERTVLTFIREHSCDNGKCRDELDRFLA